MSVLFVEYPKCSTCKKAKKWLVEHNIAFFHRHIVEDNPSKEELMAWAAKSGLPLKRFFNTSGSLYREMGLKERLSAMTDEAQFELLASNGMMVKRPIIVADDFVLVGFKENDWENALG